MNRSTLRWLRSIYLAVGFLGMAQLAHPAESVPPEYEEALDLIHAFSGSGNELQRAAKLADELAMTHPKSGYSQTLTAEALSTWELNQGGEPKSLGAQIIQLTDEALRLNPGLAQAHVAKARVLVRSSLYMQAEESVDAALRIDPSLSGAIFLEAEVFRRTGQILKADASYRRFIASASSRFRKSNGYAWLGKMYEAAANDDSAQRSQLTAKAREAYEEMLSLAPDGAWKNVNFAIFLNGYPADFDAAERYALKALAEMEFPMARYHLAAARYQKLWRQSLMMNQVSLRSAIADVTSSTKISLHDTMVFNGFSPLVQERLTELRSRF